MKTQKINPVQVGDIFAYSWGYEQTNVDFYQVVSTTAATCKLAAIAQERKHTTGMSGTCTPIKDKFLTGSLADVITKRVNVSSDGSCSMRMPLGLLVKYTKPEYFSTYY
ncbi:MAG: hypothetical protein JHC38_03385 [Thiotrichales bacterium]|jgi:hypothetical protein|nr:hypothetical protein [Thiotrichales bacterium]